MLRCAWISAIGNRIPVDGDVVWPSTTDRGQREGQWSFGNMAIERRWWPAKEGQILAPHPVKGHASLTISGLVLLPLTTSRHAFRTLSQSSWAPGQFWRMTFWPEPVILSYLVFGAQCLYYPILALQAVFSIRSTKMFIYYPSTGSAPPLSRPTQHE